MFRFRAQSLAAVVGVALPMSLCGSSLVVVDSSGATKKYIQAGMATNSVLNSIVNMHIYMDATGG